MSEQSNTPKNPEFLKDCLARYVMKLPRDKQIAWAAKQNRATKDDIRSRIERIRRERFEQARASV